MPASELSQLHEFAQEIFELSKSIWAAQTRSKSRHHAEINETEFLALDILSKAGRPITVGDIQRQIGVQPAQMSRIIRALESKAESPLVSCGINAQDKRKINVELTPAGKKAYEAYQAMKLGTIEKILSGLSEADRREFIRILRLIRSSGDKS